MGTDIHGPWVEQFVHKKDQSAPGDWRMVAELDWNRDYLLFDAMSGGRHDIQDYTVVREQRPVTDGSYEYDRHMKSPEERRDRRHFPEGEYPVYDFYYRERHTSGNWLSLDEARKVQEAYVAQTAQWASCNPDVIERRRNHKPGDGMLVIPYMAANPARHPGLDLAILIMDWSEQNDPRHRPTRLCYCFSY